MKIIELLSISGTQVDEFRELFAELNPSIIVNKDKMVRAQESPETHVFVILDDDEHIIGSATLCVSELPTRRTAGVEAVEPNSCIFECKEGPFIPHEKDGVLRLQP